MAFLASSSSVMPSASAMIFWVAVSSAAGSAGAAEPEPEAEPALAAGALEPPQPVSRADVMARASVSARNLFFIG